MEESLQAYLVKQFQRWQPPAPEVVERTKRSVTLRWLGVEPFGFMQHSLLYKVQRKEKIPPWITVYSGGKTLTTLDNLAPSHPHKFRLQVIVKSTAVSLLAEEATKHYGDEHLVYDIMENIVNNVDQESCVVSDKAFEASASKSDCREHKTNDTSIMAEKHPIVSEKNVGRSKNPSSAHMWLESQWSDETWTSTDTDGTSAMCFCMGVRCGYFKQVQVMLEERPILIGAINSVSGLTPLATAVKKGDVNIVKFVLSLGAEVDQLTTARQTPLHLAVLAGHVAIVDVLLEKGANFQAQDFNGLRVEHYAVDSCKLEMVKHIMDKGGNVEVKDSNGWTPLFRAVCQESKSEVIQELVDRGSSVDVTDCRGLTLVAAARLLRNRQGRSRDSVLRLVDAQFPHDKAVANFTRLTKKIYSVHTLLK